MAWIRDVPEGEATGTLKQIYDAAIQRAGRVFNIVKAMSLNPEHLRASLNLYLATTTSLKGRLPRATREMIAVVVSQVNRCRY